MQKTSISPIDVCVMNYKSRKSREKVDPSEVGIINYKVPLQSPSYKSE